MAAAQFEHAEFEYAQQARLALRTIVAEQGQQILSDPRALANLLADLLPESPTLARILVTAAQDKIADELRLHTSDGMDAVTAARLATASFATATMINPQVCEWAVAEFARALGLTASPVLATVPAEPITAPAESPSLHPDLPQPTAVAEVSVTTETTGRPESVPVLKPSEPAPPKAPAGPSPTWTAVVTADRSYFEAVLADGEIEVASIQFPGDYTERSFTLAGPQMRIGRRSRSRGLEPEIDLAGPPTDPGVSHLHAILLADDDGNWALLDQGSSNGTQVNGQEVTPGVPVPLADGDRVFVGAWTVLTIQVS